MIRRILVAVLVATSLLATSTALAKRSWHHHHANGAAQGGNSNKGDVWIDNVGQPPGPGHENDPHLACADINLWGAKLADPTDTYTIDGWPPSGSKKKAYSGTWYYDTAKGGSQVLDVINVKTLIANAAANGDTPQANQGYHFKIQFVQDPQKHKTFWVKCPAPTPGSPGGPPGGPPGGTPPPGGTTPPGGSTVTAPGGQTTSGNGGVTVQAPSTKAPAKHKKGKLKVLAKRLRSKSGFTG
jgi:hypothetical protein